MGRKEVSLLPVGLHVVFLYISITVIRILNYHLTVSPIDRNAKQLLGKKWLYAISQKNFKDPVL